MMTKLYFAYGSNLWLKQMENRCPGHKVKGTGILEDYRWIISKRGYANIVKSISDEVRGVVYELTEADERSLDNCEGVNIGSYRKEMIAVKIDGQVHECLVYVDPVEEEGKPKHEYIDRINKGIVEAKLAVNYVDKYVRKFIPASIQRANK
ncbi:MAG: gamma-glutamylcyclotransferase [Syntrophales bacterium LBB04]|nr:gamma-glutamylcyclotransferase [Syntrophales bacterium LBB04]